MEENKNTLIWIFAVVALVLLFSSFGMGGYGMMGFGMGSGFLFMLLFWGVLIWLVVTLISTARSGKKEENPSNTLKKRHSSWKISKKLKA
ncbi:hypothetical protein HY486_03210 [Candidatus Woesearchaeota archaeon]|nr:hypothetical protein [Candidatus Woesearchaeota archaeon]